MGGNRHKYRSGTCKAVTNYTDPAASFDGINTKQSHKVATSTGYSSYNNADIAGVWSKLEGFPPGDTTPPSVDITSPADAATISGPSSGVTVDVAGTASDESGGSGIQKVEVKVGSNPFKLATATGPGGSADWSTWSASDVVTSCRKYILSSDGQQIMRAIQKMIRLQ